MVWEEEEVEPPPDPWSWWSADPEMQALMGGSSFGRPKKTNQSGNANALAHVQILGEIDEEEAEKEVRSFDVPSGGWRAVIPDFRQLTWKQKLERIQQHRIREPGVQLVTVTEKRASATPSEPLCLQCRYCRRPFMAKSRERPWSASNKLERHEAMCAKRHCEHCCAVFRTALECQGHVAVCRNNANLNRCEFCSTKQRNGAEKRSHEATCELNPAMCCEHCGKHFGHTALRNRHIRACPNDPRRVCVFCQLRLPSRGHVVSHEICCKKNPSTQFSEGECAACCKTTQSLRFPCGDHRYCATCISKMLQVGLKDRALLPLRCCKKLVEIGDPVDVTLSSMLPEKSRLKYQETMMMHGASQCMYCPNIKCGILIILDTLYSKDDVKKMRHGWHTEVDVSEDLNSSVLNSSAIGCPRCKQAICFKCRSEWHEGVSCAQYQYFASKIVDEVTKFCRKMNWMRCFQCGHVVEKKAGCNHITCICGSSFCYLCGSQWGTCKCQILGGGHALRHNRADGGGQHRCPHCNQFFDSIDELRVHSTLCRDADAGTFQCATCSASFSNYGEYRAHRQDCLRDRAMLQQWAAENQMDARRARIRGGNASSSLY